MPSLLNYAIISKNSSRLIRMVLNRGTLTTNCLPLLFREFQILILMFMKNALLNNIRLHQREQIKFQIRKESNF